MWLDLETRIVPVIPKATITPAVIAKRAFTQKIFAGRTTAANNKLPRSVPTIRP